MTPAEFIQVVRSVDLSKMPVSTSVRASMNAADGASVTVTLWGLKCVETGLPITVNLCRAFDVELLRRWTPPNVIRLVRDAIQDAYAHEVDECIRVDGRPVVDPHVGEGARE